MRGWVSLFLIGYIFGWGIKGVGVASLWVRRRQSTQAVQLTLASAALWRHFLFMLMPLLAAFIATQGWQRFQNIESNWLIALLLTANALGIYLFAAIAAMRTSR